MTTTQIPTVIELLGPPEEFQTQEAWDIEAWDIEGWDISAGEIEEAREVLADLLAKAKARGHNLDWVAAQARTVRLPTRARRRPARIRRIMLSALARYQDAQA